MAAKEGAVSSTTTDDPLSMSALLDDGAWIPGESQRAC
jgi:hypothetical protein